MPGLLGSNEFLSFRKPEAEPGRGHVELGQTRQTGSDGPHGLRKRVLAYHDCSRGELPKLASVPEP